MKIHQEEHGLFVGAPFSEDLREKQIGKSLTRVTNTEVEDYEKEAFDLAPRF